MHFSKLDVFLTISRIVRFYSFCTNDFFKMKKMKIAKSSVKLGFSKKNIIFKNMPNMNLYDKHNVI